METRSGTKRKRDEQPPASTLSAIPVVPSPAADEHPPAGSTSLTVPVVPANNSSADAGIVRFISEGYSVVGRGLSAVQPESNEVAPKYSVFGRFPHGRFLSTFEKVTPEDVWEHVAAATTQSMHEKVRDSIVKGELARRSYDPPASAQEIKELFALQIIFRGRSNLGSIEDQFAILPDGLENWPINRRRYTALTSSLSCDFLEFSCLLRTSWQDVIIPIAEFAVDEAIYSFHSRKDPTSPQRYIPRKPHPNGLVTYFAAFKTAHGPYFFDLEPDWNVTALNPKGQPF